MALSFELQKKDPTTRARLGRITTAHGVIETPVFMPVGTRGTVKAVTHQQLYDLDVRIILANTYHLLVRPGLEVVEGAGGLHRFMGWDRALVTDSGGFQVFSLASLNQVTEEGVHFRSHVDGAKLFLGPKESMHMQRVLGADIVMAFDDCSPYPCSRDEAQRDLALTMRWAHECRNFELQQHQSLFGIVHGSVFSDLRREAAEALTHLDFDGYAIGGLAVGEGREHMNSAIEAAEPALPAQKPRYLMGVGTPRNIVEAVMRGVDMFDCVMPTRYGRCGTAFTWAGKVSIDSGQYTNDFTALDPQLDCYASQFSKAYLRHLCNVDEITGVTLVTLQNIAFYLDFMKKLRQAISDSTLSEFYQRIITLYPE